MSNADDLAGFDFAIGRNDKGWVPFADHSGAERFQILSPVRMADHFPLPVAPGWSGHS